MRKFEYSSGIRSDAKAHILLMSINFLFQSSAKANNLSRHDKIIKTLLQIDWPKNQLLIFVQTSEKATKMAKKLLKNRLQINLNCFREI